MTIQRMVELLKIEHECILRGSHDDCDRNCSDCELVQDDGDLHEMYTDVIALLKEQEPMKPIWSQGKAYCGNCGQRLPRKRDGIERRFCSFCGKAVTWDE